MSLAMKRLKNIGWLALVFLVAILLYPLSLNVAALHSDLVRVDQKILETKREISFLQAELRTRASLHQLEEWNNLLYGYQPPTADQFLAGEHALAGLGGPRPDVKPVMIAAADNGVAPAGVIGSPFAPMESGDKKAADISGRDAPDAAERTQENVAPKAPDPTKGETTARTKKLANMDDKLLSDTVLKDIEKAAKREREKR
ncbi:hypothetical protein ACFOWX_04990 [Sphingorhabdus arenilitoris]|uniref:Cell division protein FtsL n=1 Tax=Sphingorhabdus arenilitoris TaxID=1490041 RepID=A0ABV8RFV7_9SPHN